MQELAAIAADLGLEYGLEVVNRCAFRRSTIVHADKCSASHGDSTAHLLASMSSACLQTHALLCMVLLLSMRRYETNLLNTTAQVCGAASP